MSKEQIQEFDEVWAKYLTEGAKKTKQPALPPITLAPEVLEYITSDKWYGEEHIVPIAGYLSRTYKYNEQNQFGVIGSPAQLEKVLDGIKSEDLGSKPLFFIYNKNGNHWVVFCIIRHNEKVKVLYKDSFSEPVPPEIETAIKTKLKVPIDFLSHGEKSKPDQIDERSCGPMSLANLEIMMKGVKENKEKFISVFGKTQFCVQKEVPLIKTNFKLALVHYPINKHLETEVDGGTKKELDKIIKSILQATKDLSKPYETYVKILKQEVEQFEKDSSYKINHSLIDKSKKEFHVKLKGFSPPDTLKYYLDYQDQIKKESLEKEKSSKEQLQKIKSHFDRLNEVLGFLKGLEACDELNKILSDIAVKYGLEISVLKEFLELQKLEKNQNISIKETSDFIDPVDINKIQDQIEHYSKSKLTKHEDIKPVEQLLKEIDLLNHEQKAKLKLKSDYDKVKGFSTKWATANGRQINEWAKLAKGKLADEQVHEAIAIMDRANELITGGHNLRDTQILSVLAFLNNGKDMGRLCQISTGEGKTTITSLLAAIKVLQGQKVDVITSNNILAEEGVKSKENFYGIFGISVRTNNQEDDYITGGKDCYKADIVYGSIANFQFDYLRDESEGLDTRNGREFGTVILDEVDNMVIDNGAHIAKLAVPFPGMDNLRYVYIKIWQELLKGEKVFSEKVAKEINEKEKELSKRIKDGELTSDKTIKIYEEFISTLYGSKTEKLKKYIKETNPLSIGLIPGHLKDYAIRKLDEWIDNAIRAKYDYQEKEQYIIKQKAKSNKDVTQKDLTYKPLGDQQKTKKPDNASNQKDNPLYWYTATDITLIQSQIMRPYKSKFTISEPLGNTYKLSINKLRELIIQVKDSGKPALCVYNLKGQHWVVFAALKLEDKLTVLYKDSYGKGNPALAETIESIVPGAEFISNSVKEQKNVECGILAVENMRILAEHIGKAKGDTAILKEFIEGFKEFKGFCSADKAEELRKKGFAEAYEEGVKYHGMSEKIKQLKLQQLRENHNSEIIEIAEIFKKVDFSNSGISKPEIRPLRATESLPEGTKNTISIEISTAQDIDPESDDYQYQYRISISKDLESQVNAIVSMLLRGFTAGYEVIDRVIRVHPDKIEIPKNPKRAIRDKEIEIPRIEECKQQKTLNVEKNSDLLSKSQQILVKEKPEETPVEKIGEVENTTEEEEYVVIPVDYMNTGQTMKNTVWSYALHQFVQLKHNLHLTSESLTSSYISNLGYIKKYGHKIYGLTGTLGSKAEQSLISSTYNVDYCKIPTYKPKNFLEEEGLIVKDGEWAEEVAADAVVRAEEGGSVLIICKTIKDLNLIVHNLNIIKDSAKLNIRIKSYSDEDSSFVTEETLESGDIVVATNISGRGTDFKTSAEVEENGGLHVCIGFLPCNQRVEDQAFGRTSRQGNEGTGQLIIRKSELSEIGLDVCKEYDFATIKKWRDYLESCRLDDVKSVKKPDLEFRDSIFEEFLSLYKKLNCKAQNGAEQVYVLKDLKEFWALWLEQQNFKGIEITPQKVKVKFAEFLTESLTKGLLATKDSVEKDRKEKEITTGKIQHNPYYAIALAEVYLEEGKLKKAEETLLPLLSTSNKTPELLYSAHFKLFEVAIEKGGVLLERFKDAIAKVAIFGYFINVKDEAYKEKAKKYLDGASAALDKEIEYIEHLFHESNSDFYGIISYGEGENSFIKHLNSRLQVLSIYKTAINSLKEQLISSEKTGLIVNSRIPGYLTKLDPKSEQEKTIKKVIGNQELSELRQLGLDTIYSLGEVHDVPKEIIAGAQAQLAAGMSLLATSIACPPSALITLPLATTMISEGITDIAFELISKGDEGFDWKTYAKGKIISYGISIITMGLSAIAHSEKILIKAINTCKKMSELLRKSPVMKKVCQAMATQIDKIGKIIEKAIAVAKMEKELNKFSKLSKPDQLSYLEKAKTNGEFEKLQVLEKLVKEKDLTPAQLFTDQLKRITFDNGKGIAESVATEKVFIPAVEQIMQEQKPKIKEKVKLELIRSLDKEKLKFATNIDEASLEVQKSELSETVVKIGQKIVSGVGKGIGNWKTKSITVTIDNIIDCEEIIYFAKTFSQKLNEKIVTGEVINNIEDIIDKLSEQLTETIYTRGCSLAIQTSKDVVCVVTEKYKQKKEKQKQLLQEEIAKSKKELTEYQSTEAERIKAGGEPKACIDGALDLIGLEKVEYKPGGKNQKEVMELMQNGLPKDGSKVFDENLGKLNRKEIFNALKKHGSEKGIVLLSKEDGSMGHAIIVKKVGSKFILLDTKTDDVIAYSAAKEYFKKYKFSKAAIIVIEPADYNEGIAWKSGRKFKELVGIDAGPGEPFKKDIHFAQTNITPPIPDKFGGSYRELNKNFSDRLGVHEVNHIPPNQSYKDTPYENISIGDRGAIAMEFRDHRVPTGEIGAATSTGSSKKAQEWREKIHQHLKNGEFWKALEMDCRDALNTSHQRDYYKTNILEMLKYYRDTDIPNAPLIDGVPPKRLISETQYYQIIENLGLNHKGKGMYSYNESDYWQEYSKIGLAHILELRLKNLNLDNKVFVSDYVWEDKWEIGIHVIDGIIQAIKQGEILGNLLIPLNLYAKHWVGLVVETDKNKIMVTYVDSEGKVIPKAFEDLLISKLTQSYQDHSIIINEFKVEHQKYANCGPEVIENFIFYLTGTRASQDKAIELHSQIIEDNMLSQADNIFLVDHSQIFETFDQSEYS